MRSRGLPVVAVLLSGTVLAGCASSSPSATDAACVRKSDPPVAVFAEPDVRATAKPGSNFVFDVTNVADRDTRVTVRFDDRLALDIRVPSTAGCGRIHHPIHRYFYRLPAGALRMSVALDGVEEDAAEAVIGAARQWSWISVQQPFPSEITVQDTRPGWG